MPTQNWLAKLLPGRCLLCAGHTEALLCSACQADLPANSDACPQCALPLASASLCPNCQADAPPFCKSVAPFIYQAPLAGLINQWKHSGHSQVFNCLRPALINKLQEAYLHDVWPSSLVPVPLHWRRRVVRGFNQAEQIARSVGRQLQLPVAYHCLGRRAGHSQQGLDRKARLKNLTDQFYWRRHPLNGLSSIQNKEQPPKHVALVDDVMTTGATCATLTKLLHDQGVDRVDVWLIARTP